MDNVTLTDATRKIGKPENWNEELDGPCVTIDVFDYTDTLTGIPFMRTVWSPSREELEALNNGGFIYLDISGRVHPVMKLFAAKQD